MSLEIPAKFHPDPSTFGEMAIEKPVFWPEHGHANAWAWPSNIVL